MRSLYRVIRLDKRTKRRGVYIILSICIASTAFIPRSALGTPVEDLTKTFGTSKTFAEKFEETVKDRSDQIIGLLIASSGFVYAIRTFTSG